MAWKVSRRLKTKIHWYLLHIALLFFCADLVAAVWPKFDEVWKGISHIGVAIAAVLATIAEYVLEDASPELPPSATSEKED